MDDLPPRSHAVAGLWVTLLFAACCVGVFLGSLAFYNFYWR